LQQGKFDVLHVQNFFPLWSPSVFYAAARCGVPVVLTLRNYRLLCVNAYLFRDNHVCEDCLGRAIPWSGIRHACYRESRAGSAVLASMIGLHKLMGTWKSKVHTYVALTDFARDKYIAGGLPAEKIVVKPNFVHPAPLPGPGGGGYALFAGRLNPEKGINTVLEAWKSAGKVLPLKLVGDGPCAEQVKAAVVASPAVEWLGRRSPEEVMELMRRAEFLVFPSEWYEGMPRTIIEAFAVGTPVIAANIGAAASMVSDGETGFHFPPADVAALRRRVEWCCSNVQQLRRLREQARRAFAAKYAGPANAEMLLAIYRRARESLRRPSVHPQASAADRDLHA
jgi:glycosyltransferase involved in cell wall biosynthesis